MTQEVLEKGPRQLGRSKTETRNSEAGKREPRPFFCDDQVDHNIIDKESLKNLGRQILLSINA